MLEIQAKLQRLAITLALLLAWYGGVLADIPPRIHDYLPWISEESARTMLNVLFFISIALLWVPWTYYLPVVRWLGSSPAHNRSVRFFYLILGTGFIMKAGAMASEEAWGGDIGATLVATAGFLLLALMVSRMAGPTAALASDSKGYALPQEAGNQSAIAVEDKLQKARAQVIARDGNEGDRAKDKALTVAAFLRVFEELRDEPVTTEAGRTDWLAQYGVLRSRVIAEILQSGTGYNAWRPSDTPMPGSGKKFPSSFDQAHDDGLFGADHYIQTLGAVLEILDRQANADGESSDTKPAQPITNALATYESELTRAKKENPEGRLSNAIIAGRAVVMHRLKTPVVSDAELVDWLANAEAEILVVGKMMFAQSDNDPRTVLLPDQPGALYAGRQFQGSFNDAHNKELNRLAYYYNNLETVQMLATGGEQGEKRKLDELEAYKRNAEAKSRVDEAISQLKTISQLEGKVSGLKLKDGLTAAQVEEAQLLAAYIHILQDRQLKNGGEGAQQKIWIAEFWHERARINSDGERYGWKYRVFDFPPHGGPVTEEDVRPRIDKAITLLQQKLAAFTQEPSAE